MIILFFAQAREAAGCADAEVNSAAPLTQEELWARLIAAFPALGSHRKIARLARNESYLQAGEIIQPGDEIAVIPPVSGG